MGLTLDASEEEITVFLQEAEEQIDLLDTDTLTLERGERGPQLLQEMFRAAHTLKGSSAAIGHQRMAGLTHAMESVFDRLRQGNISVRTEMIDTLLDCLDALRGLREEIANREESDIAIDGLVVRLRSLEEATETLEVEEAPPNEVPDAFCDLAQERLAAGEPIHLVAVKIDDECPLPAARCLQAYLALESAGEVLGSSPSVETVEAGAPSYKLLVLMVAEDAREKIGLLLTGIPDLVSCEVEPFTEESALALRQYWAAKGQAAMGGEEAERSGISTERLAARRLAESAKTVRIDVERLDNLINLVGELVIDRTRLAEACDRLEEQYGNGESVERLDETVAHLTRVTDDLQLEIMKSRLVPIDTVFAKFPRLVRDVAQRSGKKVNFTIRGEQTELDRSVVQELGDPLIHILRNAIDHGVEPPEGRLAADKPEVGQVELAAGREENHIVITVSDDGRGIDHERVKRSAIEKGIISAEAAERLSPTEAVNLIFASGLSTAQSVNELSGRGVGMDIVRTNIEKLNGSVSIATEIGRGSRFVIRLPLTLAIMPALLVAIDRETYAIPLASVMETLRVERSRVSTIGGENSAIVLRGRVLPVLSLRQLLGLPPERAGDDRVFVVAARHGGLQLGLQVDRLIGQQEIVVKPLGNYVGDVAGVAGATILGDGRVALILDVAGLVQSCLTGLTMGGDQWSRRLLA
ncbi:MAG: chemotaxis protein CheW [Chloroflexota bacterium]